GLSRSLGAESGRRKADSYLFFSWLRTIGAEAAASAARSAATNCARRRLSIPFHSRVIRATAFFEAISALPYVRRAPEIPSSPITAIWLPAPAALRGTPHRRAQGRGGRAP